MSPFSAKVLLKKSLIKDLNGNPIKSKFSSVTSDEQVQSENELLRRKVSQLESGLTLLTFKFEQSRLDCEQVYRTNTNLLVKIDHLDGKLSAAEEVKEKIELDHEQANNASISKITELEHALYKEKEEVSAQISANDKLREQIKSLNFQLCETRAKSKNEIEKVKKESKKEIKAWRKELGEERRKCIKLQSELKAATEDKVVEKPAHVGTEPSLESNVEEIECTICAKPIQNYEPDYFHGIEMNPACDDCKPPSVKAQKSEVDHSDVSSELPLTTRDSTCLASTTRDSTYLARTTRDSTCLASNTRDSTYLDSTRGTPPTWSPPA